MRSVKAFFLAVGAVAMLGTVNLAKAAGTDVEVEEGSTTVVAERESSTVGIIALDSLYGGIVGAAVGGGILLIQNDGWDGRTMALSTGIGLLAGAAFGVFDAARNQTEGTADLRPPARPETTAHAASTGLPGVFTLQHGGTF